MPTKAPNPQEFKRIKQLMRQDSAQPTRSADKPLKIKGSFSRALSKIAKAPRPPRKLDN